MIAEKLPYTLILDAAAIVFAFVLTIISGTLAAVKKNTIIDRIIVSIATFFNTSPLFFVAIIAVQILGLKLRLTLYKIIINFYFQYLRLF